MHAQAHSPEHLSDLCFLCHVKTVTGVSPKAKHCITVFSLFISLYLSIVASRWDEAHHSEFGTQAMSVSCVSTLPSL